MAKLAGIFSTKSLTLVSVRISVTSSARGLSDKNRGQSVSSLVPLKTRLTPGWVCKAKSGPHRTASNRLHTVSVHQSDATFVQTVRSEVEREGLKVLDVPFHGKDVAEVF